MKKILLKFDKTGFNKAIMFAQGDVILYNKLIKAIKENAPEIEINADNLSDLLNDPESFLFDLVVDKSQLNFNGMPISKKKALDLVEFNSKQRAIITTCKTIQSEISCAPYQIDTSTQVDKITFDDMELSGEKYVIREAFKTQLNDIFSTYTNNDNQIKALEIVGKFVDGLIALRKMGISGVKEDDVSMFGVKFYDGNPLIDKDIISRIR